MVTGRARAKLAAAFVLLASFALPQYTCLRLRAPDGSLSDAVPPGADSSAYHPFTERHYAFENIQLRDPVSWFTIITFGWPFILLGIRGRFTGRRLDRFLWWIEPGLVAGSGYLILVFSGLGRRAIGAYLGLAALTVLLLVWLLELREVIPRMGKTRAAQ